VRLGAAAEASTNTTDLRYYPSKSRSRYKIIFLQAGVTCETRYSCYGHCPMAKTNRPTSPLSWCRCRRPAARRSRSTPATAPRKAGGMRGPLRTGRDSRALWRVQYCTLAREYFFRYLGPSGVRANGDWLTLYDVFSSPNLECQIYYSGTVALRLYLVIIVQSLTN
jgi:hypothetical protein